MDLTQGRTPHDLRCVRAHALKFGDSLLQRNEEYNEFIIILKDHARMHMNSKILREGWGARYNIRVPKPNLHFSTG